MPIFEYNGQKYNVRDEHVESFVRKHPESSAIMERDGKKYRVKVADMDKFMNSAVEQPDEKLVDAVETVSQPTGLVETDVNTTPTPSPTYVAQADSTKVAPKVEVAPVEDAQDEQGDEELSTMRSLNREQVSGLRHLVDDALMKRGQVLDSEQQKKEKELPFLARLGNNMPRGGGMAGMPEYAKTNNGRLKDKDYMTLQAASSSLENAERIIAEADHNAQKGSFSDWLERSFAGGAARALGQKTFDPRNWDMGVSDGLEASALMDALDAFDSGRPLTDTQKMLLDAKAVELATNAYFGSEVGYGYKAGSVTAESLPFMLEMLINPAAGAGEAATAKMTRYALSRFGKEALKKNAKKYMATKAITRVAGDVAGAATMAATTGATGVMADALDRMNGQVQFASDEDGNSVFLGHTEGEDFKTSLKKAYRARTIENYSEMFGNYFAPVLGAGGKMVNEGLEKIGLGKVAQFIDDVSMSDIGRLVDDFEKHAQWNGVFGEYAEEVAGGIMNACLVGDQTLDADEDTGVFNLERNIETFLGVSLLGGFMSSVKTVGYRTPQYRARKLVDEREKAGIAAFAEHPDRWKYFKDYLSPDSDLSSEEDKKGLLLALMTDDSGIYSDEQKAAVLNYVNAAEAYRGMVMGKEKQRAESGFNAQAEADVEDSYEAGRALVDEESDEGLIDAKNMLGLASEDLARNMGCHAEELEETLLANGVYDSLEDRLARINPDHWGDEHVELFTKYMNARAQYEGMVERVQDDIDEKVASSHAFIDENVDQEGNITPAYLVDDERSVYVVNQSADGSSVVVRDAETGETKMVSAEQVRLTGETMSAEAVKAETEAAIREEESTKAASRIDGTVQLAPGNVYPVLIGDDETGEDSGQSSTLTIMQDNGDGTAVVMLGDNAEQQLTLSVDVIQGFVDAYHKTRLAQRLAEETDAVEAATSSQPTEQVIANDMVDGVSSTREQQPIVDGQEENNVPADEVDETALSRIPVDENGEQLFEKAPISDSWEALVEMNEGDTAEAKDTAEQMVQQAQKALEKEQKKKSAGGSTIMEIQKAKAAHKAALRDLQKRVDYWTNVANYEENMRKAEEEAKRRQRKMEQAERGRMLAKAGRYVEEYNALGPSQSFREYVLRAISSGALKFIWSDNTNGTKGLGAHLGLNTPTERGRRLWMQSNSDGVYPEVAAEGLLEGWAADQGMTGYADEATGMTSMDAFDELLDVLSSYDSPSAMFDEVMRMRSESQEYSDDEYAEMEALRQLELEAEAHGMSIDEWVTYNEMLAEHIKDVFDAVTDEEILSIFANEYEQNDYGRIRENDEVQQGLLEGQGSFEGDGGGHSMVQANGYDGRGDTEGRGELSADGIDDGGQQSIGELPSSLVSGEHQEIAGLYGYTESDVEDLVREHVEDIISVEGFEDVRIVGIKVIGSRVNGNATEESDLDVLVEYEGDAREDSLFNLFNGGDVHAQLYIGDIQVDINPITRGKSGTIEQWMERNAGYSKPSLGEQIKDAEAEVNINPTDKQKEAGNYKKGHVQIGTFNVTIEQPKGSVRSGVDANGKKWETTMQNTYGYIRGTEGVDGDHIDVFLSDDIDGWDGSKVFVVDQYNEEGSFDEHKVMLGFNKTAEAYGAYLSNYDANWEDTRKIVVCSVGMDDFEKWISSSHRKTKPFEEYKRVPVVDKHDTSTASQRGGQMDIFDAAAEIAEKADADRWHYTVSVDKETGETTLKREDVSGVIPIGDGRFAVTASSPQEMLDILRNPQNGMADILRAVETTLENKVKTRRMDAAVKDAQPKKVNVESLIGELNEKGEAKLSNHVEQQATAQPSGNRLVTDERYAELRERMRKKLGGQMNMGVDPEILAIGTEMAVYHIEKGARKFADFVRSMVADLGDAIRPYLKSFYNGARELPEMETAGLTSEMTPYDEVRMFDVVNFEKESVDVVSTAEAVVKEQEVAEQEKIAKEAIKKERKRRKKSEDSLPLLGDLFNTNTESDERGNQETNESVGRGERQEGEGAEWRGTTGSRAVDNGSDQKRGRGVHELSGEPVKAQRNTRNFAFGDAGIQLPSGDTGKLKANIAAIRTLKELEASGAEATAEQKNVLSRYVGWGGLSEALNSNKYDIRNRWNADRSWNDKYLSYYEELKSLLSEEEFNGAIQSTNTSHFTPDTVIRALWDIANRLGFKGGRISEPAMGVGHILGFMPRSIAAVSSISGFEIDSLSGRISKMLYPDADVKVQGYETAFVPKSKDLVITNVPFGKTAPYDKALDKVLRPKMKGAYNLHNYFIAKGLLELKEGGLGVFVTSSATMDGADSRFREFVSSNGFDLLGAIRLPNNAFLKNAGTSVTADVLVFRRRKQGDAPNGVGFTSLTQIGEGSYQESGETRIKPILVNEYFANNPEMMLGDMMTAHDAGSGGLYSGASQTCKPHAGSSLQDELQNAVSRFAIDAIGNNSAESQNSIASSEDLKVSDAKNGTLVVNGDDVFIAIDGQLQPIESIAKKKEFVYNGKKRKVADAIKHYNDLKAKLNELITAEQTTDADPENLRAEVNRLYDDFVSKYGTLNRNKALNDVFTEDFEHSLPFSLEEVRRVPSATGKSMVWEVIKGRGILDKRVSYPISEPTRAENISDAANISMSYHGYLDIPYMARLLGEDESVIEERILDEGIAYRDPSNGNIVDKENYLSGNVREKLEQARSMAEEHPEYKRNVEDLSEVQPETVRFGDISYRLGTPWIPTEYVDQFAEEVLGVSRTRVTHVESINEYIVNNRSYISDHSKAGLYGTSRMNAIDLFSAALNQRKPKIFDERKHYDSVRGQYVKERIPNEAETQAVAEKIMEISDKFVEFIDNKSDIHRELERIYNDKYNNYRLKNFEAPVFKHYPGASPAITLRDHQTRGVQRCLQGSTLLAHQVGTGKTFTMITSAMEMRRLGIARKPMIVVQNATLEDFVRDFYKLYPVARVLAPGKDERSAENRKRLFNLIATGDFDAIVIPQSFLSFIPDDEGRKTALIQKRIEEYEDAIQRIEDDNIRRRMEREIDNLRDSIESGGSKKTRSVKDKAKAADRIKSKMSRQLDRRVDDVMTFEQLGIDALFIDEAHNYKKIGFASKMNNVKGIDTGASQRANSLLLKVQWVQEKNGGRNVVLATGTPITNTMAEVWTMMNFVSPEVLEDYGIQSFDDFATTFGVVEPSLEFTATGNFKIADRFKSYVNVPELVKAFRAHTDVVLTEDVREFKENANIPKLKDGKMTNIVIGKNEDLEDVMDVLIKRLEAYNNMSGQEKKKWSALPLVVFTKAKQAAIDLRLLNPLYADNPNSKTNQVVSNVLKLYRESKDYKGAQLVFCDSYQSPGEQPQMDLFEYDAAVPRFNLYEDIKAKLVAGGVPASEIAIINNYDGERRKLLFEKVRNGDVRVLIGSTEKMGVGVNVQDRLFAAHHIDAPIRPMDFEQRNGRILRQGNLHATWGKPVHVVTYGVEGTLDATAYDRLRIKQTFINQMMKGDVSGRVMEEQDDEDPSGMTFNQMAATLSGDKTAQLLFVAENKLKKLRNLKRSDANSKSGMRESISNLRIKLGNLEERRGVYERANEVLERSFPDGISEVLINGETINDKFGPTLDPIIEAYEEEYSLNRGIAPMNIYLNGGAARVIVHFNEGRMVYELYAGDEHVVESRQFSGGRGLMSSLDHQIKATSKNLADSKAAIAQTKHAISGLEEAITAPFGREEELRAAEEEVAGLRKQLEEKAAENTKNSGKSLSLPENEDGNEDGNEDRTDNTNDQGERQRLISEGVEKRDAGENVGTVHDAISVREATLRGEGKEKLSDEIVSAIRKFEKEQGQGRINIGHTPWRRRVLNLVRRLSDSEIVELKNELTSASDASSTEAWDALDVIKRYQRRKEREGIVQILSGVKLGEQVPLSKIDELFESYNEDEDVAVLYQKVRDIAERIGLTVRFDNVGDGALGEYGLKSNLAIINPNVLNTNFISDQVKATTFVHELIHPTIKYAIRTAELIRAGKTPAIQLPSHVLEAAQGIVDIFEEIKDNDIFKGEHYLNGKMYGVSVDAHEMVAELANPVFREKLKRIHLKGKNVFESLVNLIKRIFGIESAYTKVSKALETILEGFDVDAYNQSRGFEEYYKRKEESLFYREGEGAVSDKDVSFYNDPIAKFLGKPRYYGKKAAAFAERERRRMKHGVSDTAEKLGLKVEIVDDAAMVSQRTQQVMRNHPDAKGWYDPATGNIVVVVGNHVSKSDAVQTVLHEGIAHHGLRKLFGKHFDAFLDNVYSNAEREVREKINVLAQKNGWDLAKATEEYLASLAEDTEFEHARKTNWWSRIKQFFLEMLTHAGVKLDIELSDNELRYILWRSYMNMAHPGQRKSFADIAEDVVMQSRLAVGNHSAATVSQRRRLNRVDRERVRMQKTGTIDTSSMIPLSAERDSDEGLMFRKGGKNKAKMSDGTREEYGRRVKIANARKDGKRDNLMLTWYNFQEAMQDEMLSLKIAQDIVEKKYGIKLSSGEDAYKAENALSSINKSEYERFRRGMYEDMVRITDGWIRSGIETAESIRQYLIAKSGLERNREFTVRDGINERIDSKKREALLLAQNRREMKSVEKDYAEKRDILREAYIMKRNVLREKLRSGEVDYVEFNRQSDALALQYSGKEAIVDYSGLTGVTGDADKFRDLAEDMVLDFENRHGVDDCNDFWDAINRCTKATLRKSFDSGLMSRKQYEYIGQMFEWYIPMRGFSERTAEDVYSYIDEDMGGFNATVKAAKGHLEESDDPLSIIGNMMQSAILQGNRNLMKLNFLNMVLNYKTDLFTVEDVWLVEQADGSWKSDYPEITDAMSAEEVSDAIVSHTEKMESLAEDGLAKRYREGLDIDYKIEDAKHRMQHAVTIMRGGKRVVVYVNGNPRVAQALNGELKDKTQHALLGLLDKTMRWYSASKTSYDANFVLANLSRDTEHATMMTLMEDGAGDAGRFLLNILPSFSATIRGVNRDYGLSKGTNIHNGNHANRKARYDAYFEEFLKYGGETGYSHLLSVDDWKGMNERRLGRLRGLAKGKAYGARTLECIADAFEYLNRIAEDTTRFNVYSRCRERGMDIRSSILAAKDITTNFNKKGSGQTPGVWGAVSGVIRRWVPFANPIIQGLYRLLRVGKEHKVAFSAICAGHIMLGVAIPLLNELLVSAFGGDDDDEYKNRHDYMNQNAYTRRNNLMVFLGGGYFKLPLAPMFRELYGIGDIIYCALKGDLDAGDAALDTIAQLRSMFSIEGQYADDFSVMRMLLPGQLSFVADIEQNITFTGAPLYKETPYQPTTPEYTKVYKDAWTPLVDMSRMLNRLLGGTDEVAAKCSSRWMNPHVWQHILTELGGGPLKLVGDVGGIVTDLVKGDFKENFSWRNVPVAKRFWASSDDRTADAALNRRYYNVLNGEYADSQATLRSYKRKYNEGVEGYAEKLDEFMNSPLYRRYELIHDTKRAVKMLSDDLMESGSDSVPVLEDSIRRVKRRMLEELDTMSVDNSH